MALGKEIGDFSFKLTSVSYPGDDPTALINVDGTATGYGTVLGTLTLRGEPGAKGGPASWRGDGFLDDGEMVHGIGHGTWEEIGHHKWRTRMIIAVSDGQTFASDGELDLATRSFSGKNLEWS
jgi:hypothetical protein